MTSTVWHGRRGPVILGPTEHRVARYLELATRHGRVTLSTLELARRLNLERSEAYRITARLRLLGLFGVENDRGGHRGGRRWWRTAVEHDGAALPATRHRDAWSRIRGWVAGRRRRAFAELAAIRQSRVTSALVRAAMTGAAQRPASLPPGMPAALSFRELFARHGGRSLLETWGVDP